MTLSVRDQWFTEDIGCQVRLTLVVRGLSDAEAERLWAQMVNTLGINVHAALNHKRYNFQKTLYHHVQLTSRGGDSTRCDIKLQLDQTQDINPDGCTPQQGTQLLEWFAFDAHKAVLTFNRNRRQEKAAKDEQ